MQNELRSAWDQLCDKWREQGYDAFSEFERDWLNLRILIDSVENGGLLSYFYNSGADTYSDLCSALDRIGAEQILVEVRKLAGLFPEPAPSTMDERNLIINAWDWESPELDGFLRELDDRLMPMMEKLDGVLEEHVPTGSLTSRWS
jgi:hypothetical protein